MSRRVRVVAICAVLALGAGCQSSPGPAIGASSRANVPLSTAPIAFVLANPSGLLALDASGGVVRKYDLPPDAFPSGPAIAPDGRQVVFALTRIGANGFGSDILAVNLDGSGMRSLVVHEQDNVYYASPAIDPSGRYLYFGRRAGIVSNGTSVTDDGVERLDLRTNARTRLIPDAADLTISVDGRRLVFAHLVKGQVDTLWTANADGSQAKPFFAVKDRFFYLQTPRSAPSGCQVVFSGAGRTARGGGTAGGRQAHLGIPSELYLVPCDGSKIDTIAETQDDVTPAWSPDATKIAYVIGGGLYTLTVATREVRRIGQNDAFSYGDLVWLR